MIIDPLPSAWLVPYDRNVSRILQAVQASRAKYDAVILLESASHAYDLGHGLGLNLTNLPAPWRKMIRESGFIPVRPDDHDEADFGRSYWLLEYEGEGKTIKRRT